MKKRKAPLWFGYLDAGERSSPVVRDLSLHTGRSTTIYLFNFAKRRILEYRKDIVEPKLSELSADESSLIQTLQEAYQQARADFTPRGEPPTARPVQKPKKEPEIPDFDGDQSWPLLDDAEPNLNPSQQVD